MARPFAPVPQALAATLLFAACVDLTSPLQGHKDAGAKDGPASADVATGGSGGAAGFDAAAGGTTTGGIDGLATTGGTSGSATDGAAGNVALDAGAVADGASSGDGGIDVPFSGDTNLPVDQGTGGSRTDGAIVGGTGGARTGGATTGGTGGTATGGAGGTVTVDAKADATPSRDGKIDVPFSGDTSPPSDLGAGGSDGGGTGGAGGAGTGGIATGGTATGGTATGGTATGGTATGGTATGGAATGGAATGGAATGGAATGGAGGTGGSGTGGTTVPMIISIRFVGGKTGGAPGTTTMGSTETAGFKPAMYWNSATSNTNGTSPLSSLLASDGSMTSASVTWNATGTWTVPFNDVSGAALGDAHMMNGFLEAQNSVSSTITIGVTLPSSMSGAYDVYVYCYGNIDVSTRTYRYTIGSTTHDVSQTGHSVTLFSALPSGHTPAPAVGDAGAGTYVLFQNVTGATFTLTANPLTSTATVPALRAPVNGIQIVYPAGS